LLHPSDAESHALLRDIGTGRFPDTAGAAEVLDHADTILLAAVFKEMTATSLAMAF
jgi:hypothetical protein